jgi:hypothetical protein
MCLANLIKFVVLQQDTFPFFHDSIDNIRHCLIVVSVCECFLKIGVGNIVSFGTSKRRYPVEIPCKVQ